MSRRGAMTLDDLVAMPSHHVRARRAIADVPTPDGSAGARRGDVGELCDVDTCNGVAFVDFGGGAIACTADELEIASRPAPGAGEEGR